MAALLRKFPQGPPQVGKFGRRTSAREGPLPRPRPFLLGVGLLRNLPDVTWPGVTLTATVATFVDTGIDAGLTKQSSIVATVATFTEAGPATGMTAQRRLTAAVGVFSETGNADVLAITMSAAVGAFSEIGNGSGMTAQRKTSPAVGPFVETGQAAGLGISMPANVGAFVEVGNDATIAVSEAESVGAFSLTGVSVGLTGQRKLVAAAGSFTETGNEATLTASHLPLAAVVGTFLESGGAVVIRVAMPVTVGSFSFTGQAVILTGPQPRIITTFGAFSETGNAAAFLRARRMVATVRVITLTGNSANFHVMAGFAAGVGAFHADGWHAYLGKSKRLYASRGRFAIVGIAPGVHKLSPYLQFSKEGDQITYVVQSGEGSCRVVLDGDTAISVRRR